jgi:predicted GH43/DUF377 family glycosyl hydrolase
MIWEKRGHIYAPKGDLWWAKSYATLPTADVIDDQIIRIYFASLDEHQYGRIGYVDLDADAPEHVLAETPEPILDIGDLGSFDDSGVNPSCLVHSEGKNYLYYIGWQRCERVPYMLFSGLAISDNEDRTFEKYGRTPILERTDGEPFSRSAPFVMIDNDHWKMWYWSCVEWSSGPAGVHYNNVIRYASSGDGINWEPHEHTCIEPDFIEEYSVGRPWVIQEGPLYRMWYSVRSLDGSYRIGYAESENELNWVRKDEEVGIENSASGWDSEMICYPCVVDVKGERYMFYNGNRHGSSGFGYAVLRG